MILSNILLCWTAVHLVSAAAYGFLAGLRRLGQEYLLFSILSLGMGVYCLGASFLAAAPDPASAALAQRLQFVGSCAGLAAFGPFIYALIGRTGALCARLSIVWGVLSAVLDLAGLFFDPSFPIDAATRPLLPIAPTTHEVHMLAPGLVSVLGGLVLCSWATWDVVRAVRSSLDLRLVMVPGLLATPAWGLDMVAHFFGRPSVFMMEHVATLGSVFVGYLLTRRFVDADMELERRTEELRHAYEDLRHVQHELVRKEQLAAVGELSAVIAHEVRNPLAILKNAVAGLRRGDDLAEDLRATLLGILDEETDRLNRLVRDLLSYARPVEPQSAPVEVAQLVERSIAAASRGNPRASQIELDVALDSCPATIPCDKDLLERAILNVVENAMQAMPNGGRLSVHGSSVHEDGTEWLRLTFSDTGEGMDTLVRSRAREPFFTTRPSGTGLGLAIVERVVTAHGGRLELGRNSDSGTTVAMMLPREPRS